MMLSFLSQDTRNDPWVRSRASSHAQDEHLVLVGGTSLECVNSPETERWLVTA